MTHIKNRRKQTEINDNDSIVVDDFDDSIGKKQYRLWGHWDLSKNRKKSEYLFEKMKKRKRKLNSINKMIVEKFIFK